MVKYSISTGDLQQFGERSFERMLLRLPVLFFILAIIFVAGTLAPNDNNAISSIANIIGIKGCEVALAQPIKDEKPSISINDNESFTNSPTAIVTNGVSNMKTMRFSLSQGKTWSKWEKYSRTKAIRLIPNNGRNIVMAQFGDKNGNRSPVYSASIIFDVNKPTVKLLEPASNTKQRSSVRFKASATDGISGIKKVIFYVNGKMIEEVSGGIYEASWYADGWIAAGTRVYAVAVDGAGNRSTSSVVVLAGDKGWSIKGRITDSSGKPVEGAVLIAASEDALPKELSGSNGQYSAIAGAGGRYSISIRPSSVTRYKLSVRVNKRVHKQSSDKVIDSITLSGKEPLKVLDIELEKTGSVTGKVVDISGKPIQGALATAVDSNEVLQSASDVSDSNGNFTINSVSAPQKCIVAINKAGYSYAESTYTVEVKPSGLAQAGVVALSFAGRITGKVVNVIGEPLEGVDLIAWKSHLEWERDPDVEDDYYDYSYPESYYDIVRINTKTDSDGVFTFEDLDAPEIYSIAVKGASVHILPRSGIKVEPGQTIDGIRFETDLDATDLESFSSLEYEPDSGKTSASSKVRQSIFRDLFNQKEEMLSDKWESSNVKVEDSRLRCGGYFITSEDVDTFTYSSLVNTRTSDYVIEANVNLCSTKNQPAAYIMFRAKDKDNCYEFGMTGYDDEAKYAFYKKVNGERTQIGASSKGWNEFYANNEIRIEIYGNLFAAYIGNSLQLAVSDQENTFSEAGKIGAENQNTVYYDNLMVKSASQKPWSITGKISDPSGIPMADIEIQATKEHSSNTEPEVFEQHTTHSANDGTFCILTDTLDMLEPSMFGLNIFAARSTDSMYSDAAIGGVALSAEDPTKFIDIRLVPTGALSGKVVDLKGRPIAGAIIYPYCMYNLLGSYEPVLTDAKGVFTIAEINAPNDFLLGIDKFGYSMEIKGGIMIASAQTTTVKDIVLSPAARITGQVVDSRGKPVAGASVRVAPAGNEDYDSDNDAYGIEDIVRSAKTNQKGYYTVEDINAPGKYGVFAYSDADYQYTVPKTVTVNSGQTLKGVNFKFKK